MSKWQKLCFGLAFLALACVLVRGQGPPPPQVLPIPTAGGGVFLPAQPTPALAVFPSALPNLGGNL
jgi:hypothetical protein